MTMHRLYTLLLACSPIMFCDSASWAQEVYRWVDENGVVNYSDTAPRAVHEDIDTLQLDDTTPAGYDPSEDRYHVAAQAERMQALREEMEKQREQQRERLRSRPAQTPQQYPQGVRYGYPYGYPVYPRPPNRPPVDPRPPRPEPYEISTLRPPGQLPDPNGP
jgi:hypothetical protein